MKTISIPEKLFNAKELIVIDREEYEEFLRLKNLLTFLPTTAQRNALKKARMNKKHGKSFSLYELKEQLEHTN